MVRSGSGPLRSKQNGAVAKVLSIPKALKDNWLGEKPRSFLKCQKRKHVFNFMDFEVFCLLHYGPTTFSIFRSKLKFCIICMILDSRIVRKTQSNTKSCSYIMQAANIEKASDSHNYEYLCK